MSCADFFWLDVMTEARGVDILTRRVERYDTWLNLPGRRIRDSDRLSLVADIQSRREHRLCFCGGEGCRLASSFCWLRIAMSPYDGETSRTSQGQQTGVAQCIGTRLTDALETVWSRSTPIRRHCHRRVHARARKTLEVVLSHRLHFGRRRSDAEEL